jgi:hypothetical protein
MPPVVVLPTLTARIRAKELRGAIAGQTVRDTSFIIANAILEYQRRKDEREEGQLQVLKSILDQYGSAAGQPALDQFDQLLGKRYGIHLPKDPMTGKTLPPPPTTDKLITDRLRKDPELLKNYVEHHLLGTDPFKQKLELRKAEETEAYHAAEVANGALNAQANMLRARRAGLKALAANAPSGQILMPDGKLADDHGQDIPPGAKRLMRGEADVYLRKAEVNVKEAQLQAELNLKAAEQRKIEADTAHHFLATKDGQALIPFMVALAKGQVKDSKQKVQFEAYIDDGLKSVGMTPEQRKDWLGRITIIWRDLPEPLKRELEAVPMASTEGGFPSGAPSTLPGVKKLKSGKILEEEIP